MHRSIRANSTLTARANPVGIIIALMVTLLVAACGASDPDVMASVETLTVAVHPSTTDSVDLQDQTVSGTIVVSIEAEGWMRQVRFYLDGALEHTASTTPFAFEIDTTTLDDGPHTLGIEALMANGRVRQTQEVAFVVANEGGPSNGGTTHPDVDEDPDSETEPPATAEPTTPLLVAASNVTPIEAFDLVQDTTAASGRYVAQPANIPASSSGVEVASVEFDVEVAADYTLWARLYGPDRDSDAVYIGFDGATNRVFTSEHGTWVWIKIGHAHLETGTRRVSIGYGEPGLRLDVIAIVGDESIGTTELEHLATTTSWQRDDDGHDSDPVSDPEDGQDEPAPSDPEDTEPAPAPRTMSMVGEPSFAASQLSSAERLWYDRTWYAVNASTGSIVSQIGNDNVYDYGRTVYQHNHSLLLALRATGDLRFLDAVDATAQAMRAQLDDSWCGDVDSTVYVNAKYGTVSSPDGFRNFRMRRGSNIHTCRDTGTLNEALTHGHLALVMYAYHVNRNNPSPAGVDYGERADFWLDYLRNDFEAKWRQRAGTVWPAMDFMEIKWIHTYTVMNMYFYFVGQRLASDGHRDAQAYLDYSDLMSDAYFTQPYVPGSRGGGFMPTNTAYGDAVVYSFGAPLNGTLRSDSVHLEAAPSTYTRYAMSAMTTLTLEGNPYWNDAIMMRLANGLNAFVFDSDAITSSKDTLAAGVTGSSTVEGIPPTEYRDRLTVGHYSNTTMPTMAIWDASGRIENLSLQIYNVTESNRDRPSSVQIPISMLLVESATTHQMGLTAAR